MATRYQILLNAHNDIKCNISEISEDIGTNKPCHNMPMTKF